jgi:hypothetical protein
MSDFYTDADEGPGSPWDRVGRELVELEREVGPQEGRGRRTRDSATPRAEGAARTGAAAHTTYPGDDLTLPRDTPRRDLQPPTSDVAREADDWERLRGHRDA